MVSFLGIRQPEAPNNDAEHTDGKTTRLPDLSVTGTFAMLKDVLPMTKEMLVSNDLSVKISHSEEDFSNDVVKSTVNGNEEILDDGLKKTKKGVILNPQPSDLKKDPLNWPIWRRDLALLCVGWHCFVGGGQTSMLAAGFSKLSEELGIPLSQVSFLVGPMMLSLAVGAVIVSPTAVLFGKRMVYLIGILIFLFGSIGCSLSSTSFTLLLIFRVVSGLGLSTVESLPSATIAEIYFAHERAYRLGIYTLLLLGGKNLVPLLGSLVFENLGTKWLFQILAIISAVNLLMHLFFVPETFWDRTPVPSKRSLEETEVAREIRTLSVCLSGSIKRENLTALDVTADNLRLGREQSPQGKDVNDDAAADLDGKSKRMSTLAQSNLVSGLRLYHGRHSDDRWYKVMLRPFVLFSYPAVLFGSFLYAYAVVMLIMISQVIDHAFQKSYNFTSASVGLVYVAPFIGGCIGSLFAGKVSDYMARFLASKNYGIYEPEYRLIMTLPAIISTVIGLLGFGISLDRGDPWIVPCIFFGILGFGSSMSSTTAITYSVDSYKEFAQESLVTLNIVKNVMGFVFSFFNVKFNLDKGYKAGFTCYAAIGIFISLCAIPLYHFGKVCRSWTDKRGLMDFSYKVKDGN